MARAKYALDNGETSAMRMILSLLLVLVLFFQVDFCNEMRMSVLTVIMSHLWAVTT